MSEVCRRLHELYNSLPRITFPFNEKEIPKNGIYVLFENGEFGHGQDRIVRIGTHNGNDQLRSRLRQHFLIENKDRSIFRKNIGRCFLNIENSPYLIVWEIDFTKRENKEKYGTLLNRDFQNEMEKKISQYIQENFSFCVFKVETKKERLDLESKLVSTVSLCKECGPSQSWLGLYSPKEKIRESGLWQVNELYKKPLSEKDLGNLERIFYRQI